VGHAGAHGGASWPTSVEQLLDAQHELAHAQALEWQPPRGAYATGACFVCFARGSQPPGARDEPGWAAAAVALERRIVARALVRGPAPAAYDPGLLALREGPLLEAAVRALPRAPDVLLVNATGHDHPRRAGLALHLGAVIGVPTVGVTHRPLLAHGDWPAPERGACSPLVLDGEIVGCWLCTRRRTRPLAVHPGWRTDLETACSVVLAATARVRAPEPLREARRLARLARGRERGVAGC
jgi:deoxyribonuclease V